MALMVAELADDLLLPFIAATATATTVVAMAASIATTSTAQSKICGGL